MVSRSANRRILRTRGIPLAVLGVLALGGTVQVTVANAAGTQLATGSGTCSAASCTITTGSYDPPSVTQTHLLVSTWGTTCYHIIFFWWCS